jgi:Flp pilus assembly pilin Flp
MPSPERRKGAQDHQREGSSVGTPMAITSRTKKGGAATPRRSGGHDGVTAAFAPEFQQLVRDDDPPSRLLEARRKCAVWRVRRRRKGVKQVLKLFDFADTLRKREDGQTMAEYGVVLAVITIAVFTALGLLSGNIVSAIEEVAGYLG